MVFGDDLGAIKSHKAKLYLIPDTHPKCCKPRSIPFAFKDQVGADLDTLERDGIVKKVTHSDWATPIVTVWKKNNTSE